MSESQLIQPRTSPLEQAAYRYFLEYRDENGRLLGDEPIAFSEFERAIYAAFFEGVRRGTFPDYVPVLEKARIEPRFVPTDEQHDESELRSAGFSIALPAPDGSEYQLEFPVTYFEARANRHKLQLVRSEKLSSDAVLRYRLTAYLDDIEIARPRRETIQLGAATVSLHIREAPDQPPVCEPWDQPEENDLAVVVPKLLLEDAVEETRDHPENEIGGFLLGHLQRTTSGNLQVEVTGLVSAHGTAETTATTVTFTPESFARAHEMIALRGANEMICGHYHSHPFRVCSACPLPMPPECISKILFFSQDDVDLMTSTFAQPWMLGLLCAVEPRLDGVLGHLPLRLYGWRRGQLVARGFHVVADL